MVFAPKYTTQQWDEAKRLRAEGLSFAAIARRVGFATSTSVSTRARQEGWTDAGGTSVAGAVNRKGRKPSPATVSIRRTLAVRLYTYVELKIRMMELRMKKRLENYAKKGRKGEPPPFTKADTDELSAVIEHINQVTEMVSEPASAAAGGRKSAINPELTALSSDIDADGLALASAKDDFRREIAEQLGKLLPSS